MDKKHINSALFDYKGSKYITSTPIFKYTNPIVIN